MKTGNQIKLKRTAAGINGYVLCRKANISRSRLSEIERGYITPTADELQRLSSALDDLTRAVAEINRTAVAVGWPVSSLPTTPEVA